MTTCHYIRTIINIMQELKKELQKAIAKVVRENRKKSITKSADEIAIGKSMWADLVLIKFVIILFFKIYQKSVYDF